jgi:hypothetical protein
VVKPKSQDLLKPVILRGGESFTLFELYRSEWLAERFAKHFGADVARSDCAGFFFTFDSALKREGEKPLYLDLAEYFALRISGRWRKFNKSERAIWRLRLLVELGLVDLPDLGMVVPGDPYGGDPEGPCRD